MKFIPQHDQMDCGPACLAMVALFHGKEFDLQFLRDQCFITREGVSLMGLSEGANKLGFKTMAARLKPSDIDNEFLPCILHWNRNHFVVLYKIHKNFFSKKSIYKIADPGYGIISLSEENFISSWLASDDKGVSLFLTPTSFFFEQKNKKLVKISMRHLFDYLKLFKKYFFWLFVLLTLSSFISLGFPILTKQLIDEGVNKKNLSLITFILLAQLTFFFGNIVFAAFQNWIMLIIGTKINIKIISDFLKRTLRLPIIFFETKKTGDFSQRIQDHEKIEHFLTSDSLLTLFSMLTFFVFFGVLWHYNFCMMVVYFSLTIISILWSFYWMRKRKILDYFRFQQKSENQENIYEIIKGASEMKLNQYEDFKRKEWEKIQERLFKTNMRILKLDQIQLSGFDFINQLKNIIVTFFAAYLVVYSKMSLGALLSVSYIIGQMNSPINQLISFFRSLQDAKLSLARLNDVQNHKEEEQEYFNKIKINFEKSDNKNSLNGIRFSNVTFQYEGPKSRTILDCVNLYFPEGKVTAIVGASGSGKTTLMKLLLKFYEPTKGNIYYNEENLSKLSPRSIRENCGVVMQDGYIFSDTIERNIAMGDEIIDNVKMKNAINIANIDEFINELPLGINTKIGAAGNGISGGQKQRILIARAIYKNPHFIFFDEATSALDAENEKKIHDNLQIFFKSKTVIIIAHRLSTVRDADNIIVFGKGKVLEQGNHEELVSIKGEYYNLVKNQLALGD
ncbi:peptidase domain-containing ABC transporter [Myroides sp. WP-1]|uniref:peptidase domain-containing ABC transporter n=1 Tax=Myroides sp. WP-1 TaxID=2759944 RepID=UPI0015FD2F06|nr:peptidase domain-containing ABC transporter [Myroides sp. WP-1]MBB1138309.1 peptidase domain-containing ABC transporter [Myroides sp. WP-1]